MPQVEQPAHFHSLCALDRNQFRRILEMSIKWGRPKAAAAAAAAAAQPSLAFWGKTGTLGPVFGAHDLFQCLGSSEKCIFFPHCLTRVISLAFASANALIHHAGGETSGLLRPTWCVLGLTGLPDFCISVLSTTIAEILMMAGL